MPTVTTDAYGDFNYTPTGLTAGPTTFYVRTLGAAVQADGSATSPLVGAWTPISFTYVAPTVEAPTISSLMAIS